MNKASNKKMLRNKGIKKCLKNNKKPSVKIHCMDPGCRACGNPTYPDCMDSCPLFDD